MLVLSVWFGWQIAAVRSERQAAVALAKRSTITTNEDLATDRLWLRKLLGDEYRLSPVSARHQAQYSKLELADLLLIGKLRSLKELEIWNVDFSELDTTQVSPPRSLTTLWLNACKLRSLNFIAHNDRLEWLMLDRNPVSDGDLQVIGRLHRLKTLGLFQTYVTDDGIRHLSKLHSLETISLGETEIGDESLKLLVRLPSIKKISFQHTLVTDKGIGYLTEKPAVVGDTLRLTGPQFTNDCLRHVRQLSALKRLELTNTLVTSDGLEQLNGLPLEEVSITGEGINDQALVHLAKLPKLRRLMVKFTDVTDNGLLHLYSSQNLAELHAVGTKITEAGVKAYYQTGTPCFVFLNR